MIAVQSLSLSVHGTIAPRMCPELWRLSNHYLRSQFDRVEVWADSQGSEWLKSIGAQYTAWHTLPPVPDGLEPIWTMGKLFAFAAQREPFLHVDGDVFLRHKVSPAPFIVQHDEGAMTDHWRWCGKGPIPCPQEPHSWNFGCVGGTAWQAISEVAQTVIDHLKTRTPPFNEKLPWVAEQMWIPALLAQKGITPTPILRASHFREDADKLSYFHALGDKYSPELTQRLRRLLATENITLR